MSIVISPTIQNGKLNGLGVEQRYPTKQRGLSFYEGVENTEINRDIVKNHRGLFYAVSFKSDRVILTRDILGSKPLYYNDRLAVSNFKKFVPEFREVLPGEYLELGYDGEVIFQEITEFFEVIKPGEFDKPVIEERIIESLEKKKFGNACLSFSGGIDSSFLAYFYDVPLIAVTASKAEEKRIKDAARLLGKDVDIFRFDLETLKNTLPAVITAIETSNPLQVSIALPIYLSMNYAKSLGFTEIVFGQGADELFGGYKRYENLIGKSLEKALLEDILNIGDNNLVRDAKLSYINEMKLHTPYLDFDIIESALSIPVEFKIYRESGRVIRKYFLRELARRYIPTELAYASKKAIQYSTNTYKMLEKVAKSYKAELGDFLRGMHGDQAELH
ncbi:asparagine synthase-related protein [Geoglobus acetivorans]|uniref:Asparagine synthetase B n=1 Tax=Geoglobus acetivorans TaxID=565033 RepID=A0ABZ3H284_GEOAI|nr:asparagine synthetase B [Geoglobus acetivorans]